ncbi:HFR019Wp [Eremothecium sinecaudum]|uniref:HFR019Wp n=1 Tax=Eremothecium sinecaudum TaxID=45286 RepID=A0A0X8HUS0_9SACH|nr:HFR019Wp [Eremothecium sinecaudum]AMD21874.1 HFR019Wp [Eremothecium sinecaudum]
MSPDLVAFDLDYTVWPCFCDSHLVPPFSPKQESDGSVLTVIDSAGFELSLFPEVPRILLHLYKSGVKLSTASRTWAPDVALDLLAMFKISQGPDTAPIALIDFFSSLQWGDKPKIHHIRQAIREIYGASQDTDSSLRDRNIYLFDDEPRNKDVEYYGVRYIPVNASKGTTWALFRKYIKDC